MSRAENLLKTASPLEREILVRRYSHAESEEALLREFGLTRSEFRILLLTALTRFTYRRTQPGRNDRHATPPENPAAW